VRLPERVVLLGQPVSHSLSPVFQNAAITAAGIKSVYSAIEVSPEALGATLRALADDGAAGNITIPHKEAAFALCDTLTPLAQRLGAVNTWWTDNSGNVHGDNTDVGGFDDAVVALLGNIPNNARVAIIGAGGSARAVVAAVSAWSNSRVAIWSRTAIRAHALVPLGPVGHTVVEAEMVNAMRDADLIVNTTPVGLLSDDLPFDLGHLRRDAVCIDLVYRRRGETPLVVASHAAGHRACSGLPMLIGQGARAFERWFGVAADRDAMWRALREIS
jgi:shikimate dehydrogenase